MDLNKVDLSKVSTPALVLDLNKVEANTARLHAHLASLNTPLRPHLKTCKSDKVADIMLSGQPGGATVSTLAEAEYFFSHGITDLIYAIAIAPGKLDNIVELMERGADMKLLLDSLETAKIVAREGEARNCVFKVLVEVDTDGHRAGLKPDDDVLIEIGALLTASKGTQLCGVLTHAGSSYGCQDTDAIADMAEQERSRIVRAAENLRAAGLTCEMVSLGSTPTAHFGRSLDGVTEVRAGVFVFQDLFQVSLGVCGYDDMALAVLAEIIGRDPETGRVFIDAGALALSKDRSTEKGHEDLGYGLVTPLGVAPSQGSAIVKQVFQEHGVVSARTENADMSQYKIGDRVLVWPNHACMTAAAHGFYHVMRGTESVGIWERVNGWKL
ncbi:MAG: alanine racemase [Robiginitomaculum sp.]|nr:MAG: alanine racemase [Robiginitomaculum sp.]